MQIIETPLAGLLLIEPRVFGDERGYFFESYNRDVFAAQGITEEFIQDNESLSDRGVVRGLHFQEPPKAQGKLVRVQRGKVWDVAVDIRKGSPTYGQYYGVELSGENKRMLWIPPGFAHGFATLENGTVFLYKCTDTYSPEHEGSVLWNDPLLAIDWNVDVPILSAKDQDGPAFADFNSPFIYEK